MNINNEQKMEYPPWYCDDIRYINSFLPVPELTNIKCHPTHGFSRKQYHNINKKKKFFDKKNFKTKTKTKKKRKKKKKINYDLGVNNDFNFSHFKIDTKSDVNDILNDIVSNFQFIDFPNKINSQEEIIKMDENLKKSIDKINSNTEIPSKKKEQQIKTATTKADKKKKNLDKLMICRKFEVNLCENQIKTILSWVNECIWLYNWMIEYFTKNKPNKGYSYLAYKKLIMDKAYETKKKKAPYYVLTDEIRSFFSNYKSCMTNLKRGNIKKFTMNKKKLEKSYSLVIPKVLIKKNGFYVDLLGNIENFCKCDKFNINNIGGDCRLICDLIQNKYYLHCPTYIDKKKDWKHPNEVCSLDPGEKVFMTYYGIDNCGMIGENMRIPILKKLDKIKKYQKILSQGINKDGNNLRNRKKIEDKINRCYTKIHNIVTELHHQTALYLCRNYKRIIIPIFETSKMLKGGKDAMKKQIKENVEKIKKEANGNKDEEKKQIRMYSKKRRLNGKVKFVLQMLSHYKFRQYLLCKAQEYDCQVYVVTEEYTTQCCPKCGKLSEEVKNRIKTCTFCKYQVNRDFAGSRSIFLKNIESVIKVKETIKGLKEKMKPKKKEINKPKKKGKK